MAVNLTTTSSDHGELRQGWSQEESASPHVIGDTSGATRETGFTAQAAATSDLLIGDLLNVDGPFDSTGNVLDVTLRGDTVSTRAYDVDSQFLPARAFPPVMSGFDEAALDQVQRLYGSGGAVLPWQGTGVVHAYYPLRGYTQGFSVDGQNQPYFVRSWGRANQTENNNLWFYYWGQHAFVPAEFVRRPEGVYCVRARPLLNPTSNNSNTNVNYLHFRVRIDTSSAVTFQIQLTHAGVSSTMFARIGRFADGTTGFIDITGSYRQTGSDVLTPITQVSTQLTGLDVTKELAVVVQWGFLTAGAGATHRIVCYAYDPAAPPAGAPTIKVQSDQPNCRRADLVSSGSFVSRTAGTGGFRDCITSQNDSWAHHYPTVVEPSLIEYGTITKDLINVAAPAGARSIRPPIHAWTGSGWDYLKMLCAARSRQMKIENGKLTVRDLASSAAVPVADTVAPPTLRIMASDRSRSVDVVARGSRSTRNVADPANFIARASLTVRVDEESTLTLTMPPGEHLGGAVTATFVDNDGAPFTYSAMFSRGLRIRTTVALGGTLTLVVRGPRDDTGLGVGPWRLTGVSVTNEGTFEDSAPVRIYTSSPDSMVTREQAGTIDNPFVNSWGDAFDRGVWASHTVGDPAVELDFTVGASKRSAYLPGQLVTFGYATYRVMQITHGRGTSRVRATAYTTVAQGDAAWAGATVATHDAYFSGLGFRCIDGRVRPLQSPVAPVDPRPFRRAYPSETKWRKP